MRYASRKARADVRRRVKGRFIKAGDAYDYDPLSPTRSYWVKILSIHIRKELIQENLEEFIYIFLQMAVAMTDFVILSQGISLRQSEKHWA